MCIEGPQRLLSPRVARKRTLLLSKQTGNEVPSFLHQEPEDRGTCVMETGRHPLLYLHCVARGQPQCLCPEMSLTQES